jgi:ATP diphosphatase
LQTDSPIDRLLEIMRRLRDPQTGCPWDLAQDYASLAPFTLEEASEVVDALEQGDPEALRDELGDLLFQVVFLSQLGAESGDFDFNAVAAGIGDKLLRRHPHVFEDVAAASDPARSWDAIKAGERKGRGETGVLANVPRSLPALARAAKLGRRAGRVGFDWPDANGARAKLLEEIAELDAAVAQGDATAMAEELGDLLLAVTSWSRHLGLDPETSLRRANRKFESRFAAMEAVATERGLDPDRLGAAEWDALWNEAKARVQS